MSPGPWVLQTVRSGYRLEFTSNPPNHRVERETPIPTDPDQREALEGEIAGLLEKKAIKVTTEEDRHILYQSSFFLTKKKEGLWRPILNLKPLNKGFIRPQTFRMETLAKIIPLLEKGFWATTIDLKDAYLHVPIHPEHQRFLSFRYRGTDYEFVALPFGLSTAPRVFTRITRAALSFLRTKGIAIYGYIDDLLIVAESEEAARRNTTITVSLLEELGWLLNKRKSNLAPRQCLVFLGATLNLELGMAFPSEPRIDTMIRLASHLQVAKLATARTWLQLLGNMASLVDVLKLCRLRMRPIQVFLREFYKPAQDPLSKQIQTLQEVVPFLAWWATRENIITGRPFKDRRPRTSITTDASLTGWGATWENQTVQGVWTPEESRQHINLLETTAIAYAVSHWSVPLRNHNVTVLSDNTTAVAFINRQGGVRSRPLLQKTWELLTLCEQLNIVLRASHLSGKENTVADALSRGTFRMSEWSLSQPWADLLFEMFGRPIIDLFASAENNRLPTFCSRRYHPLAWKIDAFSFPWTDLCLYAFPPWCMIPRVLATLKRSTSTMILIAPCWPNQPWFPLLLSLLMDLPFKFPMNSKNLLTQRRGSIQHRDLSTLHLSAWKLSGRAYDRRGFHRRLLRLQPTRGEGPQLECTISDWRSFFRGQLLTLSIPWRLPHSK